MTLVRLPFQLQEKTREEKQVEITNRIREALSYGIKVLEDAFEPLQLDTKGLYVT